MPTEVLFLLNDLCSRDRDIDMKQRVAETPPVRSQPIRRSTQHYSASRFDQIPALFNKDCSILPIHQYMPQTLQNLQPHQRPSLANSPTIMHFSKVNALVATQVGHLALCNERPLARFNNGEPEQRFHKAIVALINETMPAVNWLYYAPSLLPLSVFSFPNTALRSNCTSARRVVLIFLTLYVHHAARQLYQLSTSRSSHHRFAPTAHTFSDEKPQQHP